MALLQVNLFSRCLMRTVSVNVILPVDKVSIMANTRPEGRPYKTLYLLHGVMGNYMDWVSGTRIQRYAEEHNLAVVMPSGDNAFYVDQAGGNNYYGEFIGQELVELTRKMFPLSRKREDTFIGGLSMGGYGALRNGLKYSNTFGAIAAFSGAFLIEEMAARKRDGGFFLNSRSYAQSCFGDLSKLIGSDADPKALAAGLSAAGKPMPKIYLTCGTGDSLLKNNNDMNRFLLENGFDVTYETAPGAHEWDFWDAAVKRAIEWLPTEKKEMGLGSGNIGTD